MRVGEGRGGREGWEGFLDIGDCSTLYDQGFAKKEQEA